MSWSDEQSHIKYEGKAEKQIMHILKKEERLLILSHIIPCIFINLPGSISISDVVLTVTVRNFQTACNRLSFSSHEELNSWLLDSSA